MPHTTDADEARARAAAFPDAPLCMPEQDMSPAPVTAGLGAWLPAALRRLVARDGAVRQ